MNSKQILLALASIAVGSVGCGSSEAEHGFGQEQIEVGLETAGYGGVKDPPSGTNGKTPKCFWDHGTQEALRSLSLKGLDSNGKGELPPMPTVLPGCHEIIEATVECALDQTQKITDVPTGATYVGWWGLAPNWMSNPITTKEGDLVTACVLQRLNAFGAKVQVLLEGDHPILNEDLAADVDFPFHESTAFGNMFTSKNALYANRPAFDAFICVETDFAQSCRTTAETLLNTRICDSTTLCGFKYMGDCAAPAFLAASCPANGSPYWWCNVPGQSLGGGVRVQLQYNPHPPTKCY